MATVKVGLLSVLICLASVCLNEAENCTETQCNYTHPKGAILIQEDYMNRTHVIDVLNDSSIISLILYPTNGTKKGIVFVHIKEYGKNTTWKLNSEQLKPSNKNYLSRSSRIAISFNTTGEWKDLTLSYKEIKFERKMFEREEDAGVIRDSMFGENLITPNTMVVWQLNPNPGEWNYSTVMITVDYLDTKEEDYLLLGEGKEVSNASSIATLRGNIKSPEKHLTSTDSAYIALFHKTSDQLKFAIRWRRSGEKLTDLISDEPAPDSIVQSVPICFYNKSWVNEIGESRHALFLFRQKFAEFTNRYIREKRIINQPEIKAESVQIIEISSVIVPDANFPNGVVFTTMVIIQEHDARQAVFRWRELKEIVDKFDAYDLINDHFFGFRIGNCPHERNQTWWYVAMILIVLLLGTFVIGIWMCAYNATCKANMSRRRRSRLFAQGLSSLHKVGQICGQGYVEYENPTHIIMEEKKTTSVLNQPVKYTNVLSDEDSDAEVFDKNWIKKKSLDKSELKQWTDVEIGQTHIFKTCEGKFGDNDFYDADTVTNRDKRKHTENEKKEPETRF